MMSRIYFDDPVPAGGCDHCGKDLVAVGRIYGQIEWVGLPDYIYSHADGTEQCTVYYTPRPADPWRAAKQVEGEQWRS